MPQALPRSEKRPIRVLFDITHPAQAHFFKTVIRRLLREGHAVLVTSRDKDVCQDLLKRLDIQNVCVSRIGRGILGLGKELLARDYRLWRLARRFGPDVMVARGGISIGLVGAMLGVPRVVFEDTEHSCLERMMSLPFATHICTGTGYLTTHGRRQTSFRGVPQLAYMHPRYFQPDPRPLREAGVEPDQPYIVLRAVSWGAVHDVGVAGAGEAAIVDAARRLSRYGRVLLSSEKKPTPAMEEFRNPVPVEHLHHLLSFARLFLGEGGTMAAEAALMGVPAVFCSPLVTGFLLALERDYGLVRNVPTLPQGATVAEELLARPDLRQTWQGRRQRMLADSEDIPEFMWRVIHQAAQQRGDQARTAT